MGEVLVTFKILPADENTDLDMISDSIKTGLSDICKIVDIKESEIGYGLKAVNLKIIIPDEEGKIGSVEEKLQAINGVGQVDTEEVTLT